MDEVAKYEELAALLKAERDSQLNKISAGAAERGPGLAGPTGAVGVYNQDRFIRPTVDPLIEGLVVKAKQSALQNQLKQLADAASSRYQRAASAYAAKQAAASSGSDPLTSPGENSIVEKTAPTAPDAIPQNTSQTFKDSTGQIYGYIKDGQYFSVNTPQLKSVEQNGTYDDRSLLNKIIEAPNDLLTGNILNTWFRGNSPDG